VLLPIPRPVGRCGPSVEAASGRRCISHAPDRQSQVVETLENTKHALVEHDTEPLNVVELIEAACDREPVVADCKQNGDLSDGRKGARKTSANTHVVRSRRVAGGRQRTSSS
jgi:hypothetical protein